MNWEIFDRFYNAHWFLTGYSCRNFSVILAESGAKPAKAIAIMENDVNSMIFDSSQFDRLGHFLAEKMVENNIWRKQSYSKHTYYTKKYFQECERLKKISFNSLTDKQLINSITKALELQSQVRVLGTVLNGLPLDGRNHLSNKLREELKKSVKNNKNFDKYWSLLTQVTKLSLRQKKNIEIAKLAELAKKEPNTDIEKKLKNIYEKYCWLDYMYYGPTISFKQFQNELKKAIKNNVNLDLQKKLENLSKTQRDLMNKLKFNNRAKHIIKIAQFILWQKGWRKDVEYHGFYCYEPFFREIAKRKKIKDWRDILYLLPWELGNFILKNKPSASSLSKRRKFSCLIVNDIKSIKMLIGKDARGYYKKLDTEKDLSSVTETKGQCAFIGKAKGIVKVIQTPTDMKKMEKGNILISQATSPDLIPAMKKAAAIVTATGGLICHAAITSRELKIPCIVGTGNANLIFKDGDLVEVDATKGTVKKLE